MEQASVFKSNQSQAVRLPKPVALPDCWFDGQGVSDDFMQSREQPKAQIRDGF